MMLNPIDTHAELLQRRAKVGRRVAHLAAKHSPAREEVRRVLLRKAGDLLDLIVHPAVRIDLGGLARSRSRPGTAST